MKHFSVSLTLIAGLLVAIPPTPTASATEYIRLTGAIKSNLTDRQATTIIRSRLKGQFGDQILDTAMVYGDGGNYSMVVPKNTPVEIMVSSSDRGRYSNWSKSTTFTQDSILNFNIPLGMIKISGRMVDAQGNPLTNAFVQIDDGPMDALQISNDGTPWTGISQYQSSQIDAYGNFALYSYSTREIGYKRTLTIQEEYQGLKWFSPKFIVNGPIQFIVCLPVNFGTSLSLPSYCSLDQVAQSAAEGVAAAAKLKAKQEAEAAEALKAKQEADARAAAAKKTTITCIKGMLSKKVTAIKPKCPPGYKVKK